MGDPVSSWMLANLPPEAGPLFLGLAGHWDTTRPALLVFFVTYALFIGVLLHGVWRHFSHR